MAKKYRILKNSVKCNKCNTIIESKHRHDFVYCSCRNIAIDGGKDYLKRCGGMIGDGIDYTELSLSETVEEEG